MSKINPMFAFVLGIIVTIAIAVVLTALELWTPFFRTPIRVDVPLSESGFDWSGWSAQQSHYFVAYMLAVLLAGVSLSGIAKISRGRGA